EEDGRDPRLDLPPAIAARIEIVSEKNVSEKKPPTIIETDTSWRVYESAVRFSEIYDGEIYDARLENPTKPEAVEEFSAEINLVPQQGDEIREMEKIPPIALITTPKNETVIDFGQNITGYVQFFLPKTTESGQEVKISFAETLDPDGNFYTENYRTAKSYLHYICRDGAQSYKPKFTFFGFRYIRLDAFPTTADVKNFTAIAVYSNIKQTGWLSSSNPNLNRFFENVIWSQKGNFLDVPTDCPQRDERLGWTGDAQVFVKTAALNFDVERFFTKWLADLSNAQLPSGLVPHVVPDTQKGRGGSAAWGDAATICPWEIYLAYGNEKILLNQFESMCKWVDFIEESASKTDFIWKNGIHFGDWLSLELPPPDAPDIRRGATRHDFLATAFFAHSVDLVIKAGKVIGRDVSSYKILRKKIIEAFRKTFPENDYRTQTEFILPLQFNLAENPQKVADALAKKIAKDGDCLKTGFVGTPYILHVLSRYGHTSLAYTLLLREEYPSWLYPVTKGATTIWERWDSIKPDGSFQTSNMNSFNHYAYGAAADWVYTVAAGIKTSKNHPGYARIKISPQPDPRLEWLSARLETRHGTIFSKWSYVNDKIRYEIRTPSPAEIKIGDKIYKVKKGTFVFMEGNKLNENPSETHEYHEDYEVRTIRCPSCKEFYSFIEGFPPCACPECMEIREEQRKHLREIIRENKGINAMELQKLTEIPISFILQVLEDGDITLETNTIST
ncbi:MAG: glycoside hydrolase family 78 protein, partial [Defluviitaleaceae bacterium]|nr:glycoside hydrolase family 78 protein [Defluviitaleaceae bacterium]